MTIERVREFLLWSTVVAWPAAVGLAAYVLGRWRREAAVVHGTCSSGAPPYCGASGTDGRCVDTGVSLAYEDGRELTCVACRMVYLAGARATDAEAQATGPAEVEPESW